MGDASKFYSYGCYNSNVGLKSLAKKIVYEDELSLTYDDNGTYTLSVEDTVIGTITVVPCVEDATYNSDDSTLVLTVTTTDGTKEITVDMSELVSTYSAGDGLSLSDNTFSVVINEESDSYLTLTSDGLLLTGIKEAIDTLQSNIDTVAASVEAETAAREEADSTLQTSIDTVASNLSTLNSNVVEITTTLTTAVSNLQASDESLQSQITSNDEDIAALQEAISSLGTSDSDVATYTAGTGISIDNDAISIDEEYTATVEQVETVTEWIDSNVVTGNDVDTYIIEVEDETNYGMAKAMGVE